MGRDTRWQYKSVQVASKGFLRDPIASAVESHERRGWELHSQTSHSTLWGGKVTLVFRRPKQTLGGFLRQGFQQTWQPTEPEETQK